MKRLMAIEQAEADRVGFVELRIHGVSGTPPEELLGQLEVVRVRGDETAGFFRPRAPVHADGDDALEAYSWGGLTSRSWTRALWVVLTPFALLNVAGWMLPRPDRQKAMLRLTGRGATGALRLLGFGTTLMVAYWIGQATMEFAAFQCGGSSACLGRIGWLEWLFGGPLFVDAPGRRLLVGAFVPLAAVGVLWRLGQVSRSRYGASLSVGRGEGSRHDQGPEGTFADPSLWTREQSLDRLATLHLAGAVSFIAHQLVASTSWVYAQANMAVPVVLAVVTVAARVTLVAIALVVVLDDVGSDRHQRRWAPVLWWLSGLSLIVAALAAWVLPGRDPTGLVEQGVRLAGYGNTAEWLFVLITAVFAVFALALLPQLLAHRDRMKVSSLGGQGVTVGFRGAGAWVAALLGHSLAAVLLLSVASWVARYLGGQETIAYHVAYDATAIITATVAILVLPVLIIVSRWRRGADFDQHVDRETLDASFPREEDGDGGDQPSADLPSERRRWLKKVRRQRVFRSVVGTADTLLGTLVMIVVILSLLAWRSPGVSPRVTDNFIRVMPAWLVTVAVWLVAVGLPVALFVVVRRSFSDTAWRRRVGILWDVLTFWPRWYHPLAPPSYSARAVPELQTRLRTLTEDGASVVLSAHSQGSVIALAALDGLRLAPLREDERKPAAPGRAGASRRRAVCERVALLTYGSPITRLYLKYFPAHLAGPIQRVAEEFNAAPDRPRWLNLYRVTDPIGGAISGERSAADPAPLLDAPPDAFEAGGIHNPLPDPDTRAWTDNNGRRRPGIRFPLPGDPYPSPLHHSNYYAAPEYRKALRLLQESLGHRRSAPRSSPRSSASSSSTTS